MFLTGYAFYSYSNPLGIKGFYNFLYFIFFALKALKKF